MPGNVDSRASRGCHRLLRDGAILVESADDVLEALGPLVEAAPRDDGRTVHHPAELLFNDTEQKVLDVIRCEATSVDEIVVNSGLPIPQVLATLSVLEMRHLIRRLSGTTVIRLKRLFLAECNSFNPEPTATAEGRDLRRRWLRVKRPKRDVCT